MSLATLLHQLLIIEQDSHHSPLLIYEPSEDHEKFYEQLCQAYLDIPPKQRFDVQSAVRSKPGVVNNLLGYIYKCVEQVQETGSEVWLNRGLAAGSMRGSEPDFRDFYMALADLYMAAKDAGLNPRSAFNEIGGGVPAHFETSGVMKSRLASDHEEENQ